MTGLVAWIGPSSASPPSAFRQALSSVAERGRGGRVELAFEGGWIGAAVDDPGDVGTFGDFTVALDGRPANLRALTAEQAGRESAAATPAEVVAAVFSEIGVEHGLSRMEGSFAAVAWNSRSRTLSAIRDRVGARPMFVGKAGGGTLAASSPLAIRGAGLDLDALDRLCRLGFLPPPLSAISGVERVPAGCLWRSDGGTARWWDLPPGVPGNGGALVRWVQSLEFAARLCVRSAMSSPAAAVWVEDAAGLAVLAAARHPIDGKCVALVVDVEGEPAIAIDAAHARSIEHVPLGPADLEAALDDLAALDEPAAAPDALLWWAIARRAEPLGIREVLTGRGAEAWLEPRAERPWRRFTRAVAPPETCPELDRLRGQSEVQPPSTSWLERRVFLPEGSLRTADLVGTGADVTFSAPLCDPRLVQLGSSVPVGHHADLPARLWAALGASGLPNARPVVPIRRWLTGPAGAVLIGLADRLEHRVEPASVRTLIAALPDSDAAANRLFALLVIERWARGR